MAEYILRDQAIIAVTGAKLPDVSASGLPIANGKRSVTDCVRRLKDIPAADVRPVEWIPVTERLPEVRTWVLCYCRANSFDVFRMTDEGNWQYGNRSIYMKGYVTHWMPLPPAPKEE